MAKCPSQQAIWEIDAACEEPIKYEEGESHTSCKRVRPIMLAERKYAKELEWCPCRKRKSLDNEVFELENDHLNSGQVPACEGCVQDLSTPSEKCHALSFTEGDHVRQGPCECSVATASLAVLLDKDYGSANPRKVDPALLPTDHELTQIYDTYSEARTKCPRCRPGGSLEMILCSCRIAWDRRQHLIYLIDTSVDDWEGYLPIYRNQFPEIDLNWVYESKRCLACKERNKNCLLTYRSLGICDRIWKTQLRFP